MTIVHRPPTPATIKELYANAFRCAYPRCQRPLYKVDPETGARTLNSNVSHICAWSEGGPRWDSSQSEDANRSVNNLLLLCLEHAWEIDQEDRVGTFPVALLEKWKKQQLSDFDALGGQGWALTSDMVDQAIAVSFDRSITIAHSVLNLGGEGGKAPGAGGGGGGALGPNARGGSGGPGGHIQASKESVPIVKSGEVAGRDTDVAGTSVLPSVVPQPTSVAPGAGGGGGGAKGKNAVGGDGGGGGEQVFVSISLEERAALHAAGFDRVELNIGKGGAGARHLGEHGQDGGDTILNFVAKDGRILKTIRAKGGVGGKAGMQIPPDSREVTLADIANGFAITTLLTADVIYPRDGLVNVLSGAWAFCNLPMLPCDVQWNVLCAAGLGAIDRTARLALFILVHDPVGVEVVRIPIAVANEQASTATNVHHVIPIRFSARLAGVWEIRVASGGFLLARLPIEIKSAAP